MAPPGTDLEHSSMRLTTTAVVPHGPLDRLAVKGLFTPADPAAIEAVARDLARDLRDHGASGPQVAGARLEADVRAFFSATAPDVGPRPGPERV